MEAWIFKGRIQALDTAKAAIRCELDLGFGKSETRDLRLYGLQAPLPPHRARAASEWLKANEGRFVAVEVSKVEGEYYATVEALTAPMRGLSLNLQIELAPSMVV